MNAPDLFRPEKLNLLLFHHRLAEWLRLHKEKLWWLHSSYALALGIGIMWLGARNFTYLRLAFVHIGFIWISSLFLPRILSLPRLPARWAPRIRLLINFFNKNFYQQLLFFVLPIYYASSTIPSRNALFLVLVALSAVLSTLDVVYDRHLSTRRSLTAVFFAFNLFALLNVMLPVLWSVSNTWTTRVSAVAAAAALLTFYAALAGSKRARFVAGAVAAALLLAAVEWGRSFIPPAPLRLADVEFGTGFDKESLRIQSVVTDLAPGEPLRLYGLTAIQAPLGMKERVRHRWIREGKVICSSPPYDMIGGRAEGFRLWTACGIDPLPPGASLRLELETEGRQLIGRATLKAARRPAAE